MKNYGKLSKKEIENYYIMSIFSPSDLRESLYPDLATYEQSKYYYKHRYEFSIYNYVKTEPKRLKKYNFPFRNKKNSKL